MRVTDDRYYQSEIGNLRIWPRDDFRLMARDRRPIQQMTGLGRLGSGAVRVVTETKPEIIGGAAISPFFKLRFLESHSIGIGRPVSSLSNANCMVVSRQRIYIDHRSS